MDQELIAYLDQRFNSLDQRFNSTDQRFNSIDQRFEQVEELIRHTDIKVEALRDEIRLVAEAVEFNDRKTERRFQDLKQEISEVLSLLKRSYSDLNRRVTALEKAS